MVEVGMSHEAVQGFDECWTCGTLLGEGSLVVEVQLFKVYHREDVEEVVHVPVSDDSIQHNVYHSSCLSCALGQYKTYIDELALRDTLGKDYNCLPGINGDNLNACYNGWRNDLPEGNPWKEYPKDEY